MAKEDITLNLKFRILILTLVILMSGFASAETLTMSNFMQSLKTHPIFNNGKIEKSILKEQQHEYQTAEDWLIKSSAFYSHDEPSFAVAGPERTDAIQLSGSVERLFWKNGSRLQAGFQTTRADLKINPMYGIPSTYYENALTVSYTMPLLKNKNGFLNRLQYELKNFDIDITETIAIEEQENFLTVYAMRYLDWVYLLEQKKIIEERIQISKDLLQNNKKKRDANLIDDVDVIRSENAVTVGEQNLLFIESEIQSVIAELTEIISDNNLYNTEPLFDLYTLHDTFDYNSINDSLLEQSRILSTIRTQVEQLQYLKRGFTEEHKSSLDLVTILGLKNAEDDIPNSMVLDKPNFTIGLQLEIPLGKRSSKSKMKQADLKVENLRNQLDNLKRNLSSNLSKIITQLNLFDEILEKNKQQISITAQKTKEEIKLYDRGRGQLTFVILSRDEEQAAKLSYAANAVLYHKLLIQFYSLTDHLIAM